MSDLRLKLATDPEQIWPTRPLDPGIADRYAMPGYSLELPPPPASNRYWRMNRGRVHVSHEARDYRLAVHLRATAAGLGTAKVGVWFPEGDVSVTLIWYRERKAGDLDGRIKVLLDALQGLAYTNDSQVKVLNAERRDEGEGRVVVSVKAYVP